MGKKEYRYPHRANVKTVADRLRRDLEKQAQEYGMTLTRESDTRYRLKRTGAELTLKVERDALVVTVDLGWFAEGFRGRIESGLNEGIPKMLKECERA